METSNDFDAKTTRLVDLFKTIRKHSEDEFVEKLSKLSADQIDISAKDIAGNSIIFEATTRGYTKALVTILKYEPRLDVLDTEGYSLLYHPIKQSDMEILSILLESDSTTIGTSLVDIIDKGKYVPLFYCIKFNNIIAMEMIIKYGANVNYTTGNQTALHMATIRGNLDMIKLLLSNKALVNIKNKDGATPLHHACNFDNYNAVSILLKYGADPNIIEIHHELSPLLYSVQLGNVPIVKLLVEHKADPNHQDYAGNTVFTYAIRDKRLEVLELLLSSYPIGKRVLGVYTEDINEPVSCHCIDPNIVNLDGLTLGHLFIYFYEEPYTKHLRQILPFCNLNYQDNQGNTVLLLLTKYNLWRDYQDILVRKKLNIYIRNSENKTPYSYANDQLFIDMVVNAYFNYLKAYPNEWTEDWQNKCGNDCKDLIKSQILVSKVSVPTKRSKQLIVIDPDIIVNFSTFTGTILDVVSGFYYLAKKYKSCTSIFTNHRINNDVYMKQLGIIESPKKAIMSIEIRWIFQKLFMPPDIIKTIKSIINDYDYIIIPIGIILSNGAHSNCLFYRVKERVLERFEPHGSKYPIRLNYNPNLLDSTLYKTWNNIMSSVYDETVKVKYLVPSSYLPKIGFQMIEGRELSVNMNIGDPNGFCTLWCIFYLDYRLKYVSMNPEKLVRKMISYLSVNQLSFRNTIRNYSKRITDLRDEHLKAVGYDINDYLNLRLSEEALIKLNKSFQRV